MSDRTKRVITIAAHAARGEMSSPHEFAYVFLAIEPTDEGYEVSFAHNLPSGEIMHKVLRLVTEGYLESETLDFQVVEEGAA